MKKLTKASMVGLIFALTAFGVSGQIVTNTIRLDENGRGFYNGVPFFGGLLAADPSGGVAGPVLVYNIPGGPFTMGDLILSESASSSTNGSNILRFWQNNQVIFYSDREPGGNDNDLADISGLPSQILPVSISMVETGTEGNNGVIYQAHPGQPGWDGSPAGTYWVVISDAVPEPSSVAVMACGLVTLVLLQRRRENSSVPGAKAT